VAVVHAKVRRPIDGIGAQGDARLSDPVLILGHGRRNANKGHCDRIRGRE